MASKRSATPPAPPVSQSVPLTTMSDEDLYLFNEGNHFRLYDHLGSHPYTDADGVVGVRFAVWAPNASQVSVIGDFNGWQAGAHPLFPVHHSGIWSGFIPGVPKGALYKYDLLTGDKTRHLQKADPFARRYQVPPEQASVVWHDDYAWQDEAWMSERGEHARLDAPIAVYEVHLGSWRRHEDGSMLGYRELAEQLADYLDQTRFTHVELLPVMEHPYYGSWGYQSTGYFAPTSRHGAAEDFKYFVDTLHQRGYGVLLDWVPSHFPEDAHALADFDGTHLFDHADPRKGFHPDWKSCIFNYDRHEVRSFLISSARFWIDQFHADGLRVDAVASMLYLDYSRAAGEWLPNEYGGRENLGAITLLKRMNEALYQDFPHIQTIAEESTAWPQVSRPTSMGGLGFGMKWDMGWMHDTLEYMQLDPIHRKYHHDKLTFRSVYAFSENYMLPFSHDEVVHLKRSMLEKMPGDRWQQFANLRLLYGYMYAQPGKKLLFMGAEFGQHHEWAHEEALEWERLEEQDHRGLLQLVSALNTLYREQGALHELDCDPAGFEWIEGEDREHSTLCFLRWDRDHERPVLALFNFTPVPREDFQVGVPEGWRHWRELLSTDDSRFGGSDVKNTQPLEVLGESHHGRAQSLRVRLPPLGALWLVAEPEA